MRCGENGCDYCGRISRFSTYPQGRDFRYSIEFVPQLGPNDVPPVVGITKRVLASARTPAMLAEQIGARLVPAQNGPAAWNLLPRLLLKGTIGRFFPLFSHRQDIRAREIRA
jgi:hypothetical protein